MPHRISELALGNDFEQNFEKLPGKFQGKNPYPV